ncbi:YfhO family protein [Hymenobacter psychrotolerans]|uniref:DUF6311 domain-containing protein n=1 Tax=Hymenobacter psychrotolerans DSM 18569 TaxID=1121959 RepID=A0A1M6PT65_9BACT|nr:YfhO family protein [Hymenobacter psychrotolerans]SHK11098.1 hypothetical protein SAMN02746009_00333 [Hymenobacter psychrotolerans DSM 18569]
MKNWLRLTLVTGFYGLLFVVFTWPLATQFTTAFPTVPGHDSLLYAWNFWYFREAVMSGINPFHTDWLLYPWGSSLVMHAYMPLLGVLNLVLDNALLTINIGLLLSYALSGTGAYLLCRRWVRSPVLALLAGVIFAYSPYKLMRLPDHYNLVLTATVPFYVMAFLDAFAFEPGRLLPRVRSWRAVGWCFVLGLITLACDYYVTFGLLYFSLAYALWYWLRLGSVNWRRWQTWLRLAVILTVSHILIKQLHHFGVPDNDGPWWGGDVVSYLMPPPTSQFLDFEWAQRLYLNPKVFNMPGSLEMILFMGYSLLALGLLLVVWPNRPASLRRLDAGGRPLAWVLLFFVMLTLPTLRIYGKQRLNLPTGLLHFIPFFNNIRCPTRWVMMVGLLLPVVSFSALEALWRPRLRPALQTGLSVLLLGVVLFEYWPKPMHLTSTADVPAVYDEVAQLPGTTLFPIPFGIIDGYRKLGEVQTEQFFYQTRHHKKLPIGYFSRIKPEIFDAFRQDTVLGRLLTLQTRPDTLPPPLPTTTQVQTFLRTYQPAAFVVHPDYQNQPVHRYLCQMLAPLGYTERQIGGYLLLAKTGKAE